MILSASSISLSNISIISSLSVYIFQEDEISGPGHVARIFLPLVKLFRNCMAHLLVLVPGEIQPLTESVSAQARAKLKRGGSNTPAEFLRKINASPLSLLLWHVYSLAKGNPININLDG